MYKSLREVFFPTVCNACGAESLDYLCAVCVSKLFAPMEILGIKVVTGHNPDVVNLVRIWKERDNRSIDCVFQALLIKSLVDVDKAAILTCIPTRSASFRKRGRRSLESLVSKVAEATERGFIPNAVVFNRKVEDQRGLDRSARQKNLQGAFDANISNQSLVLIDDVITSGATIAAAKRVLVPNNHLVQAVALVSAKPIRNLTALL